jgi:D-aminoacyl-tRNA deacylase
MRVLGLGILERGLACGRKSFRRGSVGNVEQFRWKERLSFKAAAVRWKHRPGGGVAQALQIFAAAAVPASAGGSLWRLRSARLHSADSHRCPLMRLVLQRVSSASVTVDEKITGQIGTGLLILAGIEEADTHEDLAWLVQKVTQMRIFGDAEGKMNLSVKDVGGGLLVVSQFTLHASTRKGNRPSFIRAARPEAAIPLYEQFLALLEAEMSSRVERGIFGADMKVALVNDGPVTICIDSRARE